ncbi:CW7 isoform X2 [Carex rostrata]
MAHGEETIDIPISAVRSDDKPSTPSRFELLSMVKKQSKFLREIDSQDSTSSGSSTMASQFWREMLDLYFVRGNVSKGHEEDDLIFFVRAKNLDGYEDVAPFFVRRWAPSLERVVGTNMSDVDWARTFYLNLIAHTSFSVTVAICSIQALRKHQNGENSSLSPVYKVIKTVFASPSRVDFQLDHKKILSEVDHCYCVVLNAHDGAAFPSEIEIDGSDLTVHSIDEVTPKLPKATLFSGFVSYEVVRKAYDAGHSRLGSILSSGGSHTKTDRLFMKGPGGRGEVEVAVSGVADQSQEKTGPSLPLQLLTKGIGTIMHMARNTYSGPASSSFNDGNNSNDNDRSHSGSETILPLKCSLMSISLPWDTIAHDLLFKASPPLNL